MINNLCNNSGAVFFVKKHKDDCQEIADDLQVPLENILGLAAMETLYGKGRISIELHNYFSMRSPAPNQIGFEQAQKDPKVKLAKYISFRQSANSFSTKYGSAVKGKKDPSEFAQALIRSGFNTGKAENGGRADFASFLVGIINAVKGRLTC